jgi:hypothetical protein
VIAWVVASTLVGLSMQPAEPRGFALQWEAPDDCPGAEDVTLAIGEVVGDDGALERTDVRAQARVEARDDGFVLALQIGEGRRELVGKSCEEVAATAAFLVAIAIDPRALGKPIPTIVKQHEPTTPEVPPPSIVEPPPEPTTPAPTMVATPTPTPAPAARTRAIAIAGRVAAGIGLGPSPRTTGAFAASVGIAHRFFRAELEGQYWIPRRLAWPNDRDIAVIAQLWTVGLRGCGVLARGRLEIPLCALAQAGLIHAKGDGDLRSQRARVPWVGVGGGVMAIGWLGERVGLGAGVDVLGSVVRGGFEIEPSGDDVDRVGPVALTALVGLYWRSARPRARPVLETARAGQPGG